MKVRILKDKRNYFQLGISLGNYILNIFDTVARG